MEGKKFIFFGISLLLLFGIPLRLKRNRESKEKRSFNEFIEKFNKTYGENDVEYFERFENFKTSLRLIEELNGNGSADGNDVYGLTPFSDLSREEFVRIYLRPNGGRLEASKGNGNGKAAGEERPKKRSKIVLPERMDWRERGIIGAVNNQKNCGACWAFSTIETVEAMKALKVGGSLVRLSVQEVIDCSGYGNRGCEGGDSCSLLKWLWDTKTKVTTEKSYPFSFRTEFCRMKNVKAGVQIKNFACENLIGSEESLLERLAFHGPVAAAVNALNWQFYLGGIIQFHCPGAPEDLNHAVQIVGFDRTGPVPYYVVRNSWGPRFGNGGYLRLAVGGNVCGLANQIAYLDVV